MHQLEPINIENEKSLTGLFPLTFVEISQVCHTNILLVTAVIMTDLKLE